VVSQEPADAIAAAVPVLDALIDMGVKCYLGGSLASSVHGLGRTTLDADLVADMRSQHITGLVASLRDAYYTDSQAMLRAVTDRSSFNVIRLDSMVKVDVFVQKIDRFNRMVSERAAPHMLDEQQSIGPYLVTSPEDIVLHKLICYRMGDGVSDRQWQDLVNVMKVQGPALDRAYLASWAADLDVLDLLEKAWSEADALGA
jgi:hypothetical protein